MISSFCIAGTNSGSGKTTITIALLRALFKRNIKVQPFKCGPDYIDPAFHKKATNKVSINLDSWMMGENELIKSYNKALSEDIEVAVVEGVMGLFDGVNSSSLEGSTAGIANILNIPIILVLNARGMSRSIAALVKGFCEFEKDINIVGIIANNIGSQKHTEILAEALKEAKLPPLLGAFPRNDNWRMPERHLGLTPVFEDGRDSSWYDQLANAAEDYIDIDKLLKLTTQNLPKIIKPSNSSGKKIRLALALDEAFNFYYKDNLELFKESGFEIIYFSPLHDLKIPKNIDSIYIGGGFPEMFAEQLSNNTSMLESIKSFAKSGKVIYAECGGFMYLSKKLTDFAGKTFTMCSVLACNTKLNSKLHRLGYRNIKILKDCFLGKAGTLLRGHEFHWSSLEEKADTFSSLWEVSSLRNPQWEKTGIFYKNVFASYVHVHFASNPKVLQEWRKFILSQ